MIQSIGILQAATPFPAISLPAIFAQIAHILRRSCSQVLLAGNVQVQQPVVLAVLELRRETARSLAAPSRSRHFDLDISYIAWESKQPPMNSNLSIYA
jgi:hypothetical protein